MMAPTATHRTGSSDLSVQYETLRANALCRSNPSMLLPLFLGEGMSRWMRAIARADTHPQVFERPVSVRAAGTTERALAGILADAILEAAGPVIAEGSQ